jgi:predicted Zn finger-like uncharacterized protein
MTPATPQRRLLTVAKVNCPHCDAVLRSNADLAGRRVRCGTCSTPFQVPDEGEDDRPRRRDEDEYEEEERRPRRRRRASAGPDYRPYVKAGVGLFLVVAVIVAGIFSVPPIFRALTAVEEPVIPDEKWQKIEVPGRFRCLMPGPATQETPPGPVPMVMHQCSPNKDLMCMVGYSRDQVTPDRLAAGTDRILNDGCDGAMRNMREMGATEISRSPITLNGKYPGRELLVKAPGRNGKMIFRLYLVNNIIFMVGVGGRGIEPGGQVPTKVFNSFEVI